MDTKDLNFSVISKAINEYGTYCVYLKSGLTIKFTRAWLTSPHSIKLFCVSMHITDDIYLNKEIMDESVMEIHLGEISVVSDWDEEFNPI